MTDFKTKNIKKTTPSPLPYLYGLEAVNMCLKTYYHSTTKHFSKQFCWKTYLSYGLIHKALFHPLRILLDNVTNHMFCTGINRTGSWRLFLSGMTSATFISFSLQFLEQLKNARAFAFPTPRTLNFVKDMHVGALYGLSRAYNNIFMNVKKYVNLEPYQFFLGYTITLTACDYLLSNSIYRYKYALRSTLPISLIRVLTSFVAYKLDQFDHMY